MNEPDCKSSQKSTQPLSLNSDTEKISGEKRLDKTLSIATAIMMGSVLLSRITGLLREQVIASYGGTGVNTDAYVSAFFIPEMLNHFLAGGFLSVTFIPIFQKHILKGDRDRAWNSFSNLINIGTIFFLLLIPLSMIFTPAILQMIGIGAGSKPEYFNTTVRLTRIILPAQLFFYWGAFFSAVQMAEKRFFIPAIAPLCYNGGIILGGVILGPFLGIDGFAWGVLAGAIIANLAVQLPGALKIGLKYNLSFNFRDKDLSDYIKKSIPLIFGLSMIFSNEIFFRYFASSLSEGVVSSVNYALRVMMMIVAMFGQASGAAFYPFLSKLALENKFKDMSELLNSVLTKIAVFLIPISAVSILFSEQIIALIYQRGSFDYRSTIQTASIFSVYLLGTFGFSASMIVTRPFYAMQNTLLPMTINTAIALGSIPLYIFFSRNMGGAGIALATILAVTIQFVILYAIWNIRYSSPKIIKSLIISLLKIVIISLIGCTIGYQMKIWGQAITIQNVFMKNLTVFTIGSIPSLLLVFVLYEFTGVQRIGETVNRLLKRKK